MKSNVCDSAHSSSSFRIPLEVLSWYFYDICIFSSQFLKHLRKKNNTNPQAEKYLHEPQYLFPLSNQSVEAACNSSFRFFSWMQFEYHINHVLHIFQHTAFSFFLVFNWIAGSVRKQLGKNLVTVICSVYFCDDIFMYRRCTMRECTSVSFVESDNFLHPFPFTLSNSVYLGWDKIFLWDRITTRTANNCSFGNAVPFSEAASRARVWAIIPTRTTSLEQR